MIKLSKSVKRGRFLILPKHHAALGALLHAPHTVRRIKPLF